MAKLTSEFMKDFYDKIVPSKYNNNYEHYMWFSTRNKWERYNMNFKVIDFHLNKIEFKNCLELGPGSGIWTKLLLHKNPKGSFLLFDISKEMLNQSKINLGERKNIEFVNGDFTKNPPNKKFDLFFSSRVLEYIPSKEKFFFDLNKILDTKSNAIIITKMPHDFRQKIGNLLMKKTPTQHTGQIDPFELKKIINKNGLKKIKIYPAIIAFPLLSKINFLNNLIFNRIYKKELSGWMKPFCESYVIIIKK